MYMFMILKHVSYIVYSGHSKARTPRAKRWLAWVSHAPLVLLGQGRVHA